MKKELIGYKLKKKCEQYRDAALSIVRAFPGNNGSRYLSNDDPIMYLRDLEDEHGKTPPTYDILREAGVFDIWFEPIYAPKYSLPKINGHTGHIDQHGIISYGCAKIHKNQLRLITQYDDIGNSFKDGNSYRKIKSITLSSDIIIAIDVTITIDEIKQILDYVDNQ